MNDRAAAKLAHELTLAWLSYPRTHADAGEVTAFLASMHSALKALHTSAVAAADPAPVEDYVPAVSVRKSLADPTRIISLIDGTRHASLKRHLAAHGLTPAAYRERYGLKADYPMVAPALSEARRATAQRVGLGRKPGEKVRKPTDAAKAKPNARKSISEAKKAAQAHLGMDGS